MAIKAIEIENFKGIGASARIEIKPITLLFGANSAGKSTILQALQYAREVLSRRNTNPDRTKHGGESVDLGGFRNFVHGHDLQRRIRIKLEMAIDEGGLPDLTPEPWEDWQADLSGEPDDLWRLHETLAETKNNVTTASISLEIGWSPIRKTAVVHAYEVGANGEWLCRILASEDGRDASTRFNSFNPIFVRQYDPAELDRFEAIRADIEGLIDPADIGEAISEVMSGVGEPSEDLDQPSLSRAIPGTRDQFTILPEILATVIEAGMEKPGAGLRAWLSGFDGALPNLSELLAIPSSGRGGSAKIYMCREFTAFLSSLVIGPGRMARDALEKLRYLGPIREVPDRAYQPALTPDESRWSSGIGAWDWIHNASALELEQLNKWLIDSDRLATNYRLDLKRYKEIDATSPLMVSMLDPTAMLDNVDALRDTLLALPEKTRLALVDTESQIEVAPQDIGIGVSQVIPVVVAALDSKNRITTIEQPELHIHPALQVALGDLFIGAVRSQAANASHTAFLLETHSEHLLLRLLRRLRETSDGDVPSGLSLRPDDIAVYFVEAGSEGTSMRPLELDERGNFATRWPNGFFDEREREFFGDGAEVSDEELKRLFGK